MMNEYNERLLRNVLDDIREEEDAELLKEIEDAKNNPQFSTKEGETEAFALKYTEKKKKNKKIKYLRAASVILVVAIGVAFIPFTVRGQKSSVAQIIVNFASTGHFDVMHSDFEDPTKTYKGDYILSSVPEGYEVDEINSSLSSEQICYTNGKDKLSFAQVFVNTGMSVDVDNNEDAKEIEVNGYKGFHVVNKDRQRVMLATDKAIIEIICTDKNLDIIELAKKIEKKK